MNVEQEKFLIMADCALDAHHNKEAMPGLH